MSSILLTGGSGFLGSHLAPELVKQHQIIIFDKKEPTTTNDRVSFISGELTRPDDLKAIPDPVKGIIHLGGISRVQDGNNAPGVCINSNVGGTVNVLEWARTKEQPPWIILASTVEPPENIYGMSKRMAEMCAERYSIDFGLHIITLRFTSIYGSPRDNAKKVLPLFINKALNGDPLLVHDGGVQQDFIHIRDVVQGISAAVDFLNTQKTGRYQVIPICTGEMTSLKKLAEQIVLFTDSKSSVTVNKNTKRHPQCYDKTIAKQLLGYTTNIDLIEGLKETICLHAEHPGKR